MRVSGGNAAAEFSRMYPETVEVNKSARALWKAPERSGPPFLPPTFAEAARPADMARVNRVIAAR